jgi:hypothetical protein
MTGVTRDEDADDQPHGLPVSPVSVIGYTETDLVAGGRLTTEEARLASGANGQEAHPRPERSSQRGRPLRDRGPDSRRPRPAIAQEPRTGLWRCWTVAS